MVDIDFTGLLCYWDSIYSVIFSRPVEECVGVSQGLPSLFLYFADGGWPSRASYTIRGVSCCHGGNKGCL